MHKNLHKSGVFGIFWDIYAPKNVSVKDIGSNASMALQNYQNFIELTWNIWWFWNVRAKSIGTHSALQCVLDEFR